MLILIPIVMFVASLVFLGILHLYYKFKRNNRLTTNVIYFHSGNEYDQRRLQWIHWFLEKVIFLRIDLFKNNPRGNFLWLKTIIHFTMIYCVLFVAYIAKFGEVSLLEQLKDGKNYFLIFGSYLTLINTFYWAEKSKLKDKWQYLASLYNQTLMQWNEPVKHKILSNALAIDIVTTMMWGHRSFAEIVRVEIKDAIFNMEAGAIKAAFEEKVKENKLTEVEAMKLLELNQAWLMKKHPVGTN